VSTKTCWTASTGCRRCAEARPYLLANLKEEKEVFASSKIATRVSEEGALGALACASPLTPWHGQAL
jgi:hypothetical protein